MIERSELRVFSPAKPGTAGPMRHALAAFLTVLEIDPDLSEDILMAVGEALANAVEHAYADATPGVVELYARVDPEELLSIDVADEGNFIEREEPRPGRGFGLRIVRTVARAVSVETDGGTRIHMIFNAVKRTEECGSTTG